MNRNNDIAVPGLGGIVLAGGGSARLGRPKQLLRVDGRTLVERAVELIGPYCGAGVVTVLGANAAACRDVLSGTPTTIVVNDDWQQGMSGSIVAGVSAVAEGSTGFLIFACDQLRVSSQNIESLVSTWQQDDQCIVAGQYDGVLGIPAIFPSSKRAALQALRGDTGARAVIGSSDRVAAVRLPEAVFDLDTLEDLQKLRELGVDISG